MIVKNVSIQVITMLTVQIPPTWSESPASKMVTSKPWPTQWAAADTPVRPAPMMAILGLRNLAPGAGGSGEKILSISHWRMVYSQDMGANAMVGRFVFGVVDETIDYFQQDTSRKERIYSILKTSAEGGGLAGL